MIPEFPELKKLELSDRPTVEAFTANFPPYSDFNFISMWSWDTRGDMGLSQLHGNLVVRFADYVTGEPFYSFIGSSAQNATATALLKASAQQGLSPILRLVPHHVARALNPNTFVIEAAPAHFDYVVSVERLRTYAGGELKMRRHQLHRFLKETPDSRFERLDIENPATRRDLERLFVLWFANKKVATVIGDEHECAAFLRCLDPGLRSQIAAYGAFSGETLIAFWLIENVGRGFSIPHFEKADNSFLGVVPFLRQQTAHAMSAQGVRYVNLEQDLGIEGLRFSKASYAPEYHLRKYAVHFKPTVTGNAANEVSTASR